MNKIEKKEHPYVNEMCFYYLIIDEKSYSVMIVKLKLKIKLTN